MKNYGHILVIRLSAMGDVAMMVPVLKSFSETYPETRITVLTRSFFAPLFDDIPNVEIFEAEVKGRHKGILGLKRLAGELQDLGIEAVADLHNVLRSNILKFFFKLKGIPVQQINKGRKEKKLLTRSKNKVFKQLKSTPERYADVFERLGCPIQLSRVSLLPKPALTEAVGTLLKEKDFKFLGVAAFAQHQSKVYPLDLMEKVLQSLQKEQNLKVFLFGGGASEIKILKEWEEKFPNVQNVAGFLNFQEELVLISRLDAMLSMDSANGHMAANYGVPVVTLWALTHPYTGFAPYRQPGNNALLPDLQKFPAIPTSVYGQKVPQGYEQAMRSIPVEKVVAKLKEVLKLS